MGVPASLGSLSKIARLLTAVGAAVRPELWARNLLILLPLLFTTGELWVPTDLAEASGLFIRTGVATALFCAATGASCLFDAMLDSSRGRPSARSQPVVPAGAAALVMATGAAALAFGVDVRLGCIVCIYLVVQAAYSMGLKRLWLLDCFAEAAGYVLRIEAGAAAIDAAVSPWLYLCAGMGSLFIALAGRRVDVTMGRGDGAQSYQVPVLDQLMTVTGTSALVSYALYTFTAPNMPPDHAMMLTIPVVLYGLFRYMQLVHEGTTDSTPEEILLHDRPMMLAVALWFSVFMGILLLYE